MHVLISHPDRHKDKSKHFQTLAIHKRFNALMGSVSLLYFLQQAFSIQAHARYYWEKTCYSRASNNRTLLQPGNIPWLNHSSVMQSCLKRMEYVWYEEREAVSCSASYRGTGEVPWAAGLLWRAIDESYLRSYEQKDLSPTWHLPGELFPTSFSPFIYLFQLLAIPPSGTVASIYFESKRVQ